MNSKSKTDSRGENSKTTASGAESASKGGRKKVSKKKKTTARKQPAQKNTAPSSTLATANESAVASAPVPEQGNGLVRLSLIASLLALGISAFAAYQFTLSSQLNDTRITGVEDRVNFIVTEQQSVKVAFDKLSSETSTDVKQMHEQLNKVESMLSDLQATANTSVEEIKANLGARVERWKLEEIQSLLVQVNRLYQLGGDQKRAIAGLKLAQDSLNTIDEPRLEEVSAAIEEDIISVQSDRNLDTRTLYNRLASIASLVPDLLLAEDVDQTAPTEEGEAAPAEGDDSTGGDTAGDQESGIVAAGKTLLSDIGSLVKYKDLEAPMQPSMDRTARFVIYESLMLNVEGAMAALLRNDNDAWQAQLAFAKDTVNRYFAVDLPDTKTVLDQLEVLQSYDVSLRTNVISGALDALNRVMAMER